MLMNPPARPFINRGGWQGGNDNDWRAMANGNQVPIPQISEADDYDDY